MLPFDRLKKSVTIENLWIYILVLVKSSNEQNPIHGYQIREMIEKNYNFKPGQITAYRVLYRLEGDGFVKSHLSEHKRIYKITPKGEEELEKAKKLFSAFSQKI